jgi:translation initiation factor 4E
LFASLTHFASFELHPQSHGSSNESSPELPIAIKHPLQNDWDFWYFKQDKNKSWSDCLMNIANFSAVEDFWALYNHIEVPSKLEPGCDYNMFKRGIKPMWEDPRNKNGGRLMLLIRKTPKSQPNSRLDEMWLEILLCLIGEAFDEDSDQVCGAVVNIRPKIDRISIWTGDCNQEAAIRKIGYVRSFSIFRSLSLSLSLISSLPLLVCTGK